MSRYIAVFGIIALAVIGIASSQNLIQGEAKGPDAPGAMLIGAGDQPALNVAAPINASMAAGTRIGRPVIELSGTDPAIFDRPEMKNDGWVSDGGSYGRTPSQTAFLNDKAGEDLIFTPKERQ